MSAGRQLLVVRHGQTEHNAGGVWQGHLDTQLSDIGREQAAAAGAAIADLTVTAILGSDLRRASATADAMGAACGIGVLYDARLREINVGQWQGLNAEQIEARWPGVLSSVGAGEDVRRGEDGETVAEVVERARPCVAAFITSLGSGDTGVIVTHGVSGRAIVADLVGMPQQVAWNSLAGLRNCHWARLEEFAAGWRLADYNHGAMPAGVSTSDR